MKEMPEYGQDPNIMSMYELQARMCGYDAGTPSTAAGTPPSATDSDEFNDSSTPGDDNVPSPGPNGSRRKMMNGNSSPQPMGRQMNGHMPPFFPCSPNGMPSGAMMVPLNGYPGSPGGAQMMPMAQQVVVYCVPVEQVPWMQANNGENNNGEVMGHCTPIAVDASGSPVAMGQMTLPGNAFMIPASPTGESMTGPCGMIVNEVPSPMAIQNGMNGSNQNGMSNGYPVLPNSDNNQGNEEQNY
jgi:hypothetical protein